ncbi:Eco57I restriction-modification methylase domain-containing protein [Methylophilus sp.]|uniref:Eco57I restriction-modification methylase domain-containing protein n=1 Tax=Methylophilus sp. TaxID=29541 RepID=UPI0040359E47
MRSLPLNTVNQILDLLPAQLWRNPDAKFLDPVARHCELLREIARRLNHGLEKLIPDRQARLNHIFANQLYGIALTAPYAVMARQRVYCSRTANGCTSVCNAFTDVQGNIRYQPALHQWQNGKCRFCGTRQASNKHAARQQSDAYPFIHSDDPNTLFGHEIKFDVILGIPPAQLSDDRANASVTPVYHRYVQQAKKMAPDFLLMIIPARWYADGKGLGAFRKSMLSDRHIRELHDFPDATDLIAGMQIKGGLCYFLRDQRKAGDCKVSAYHAGGLRSVMTRSLQENGNHLFIRHNEAIPILQKVSAISQQTLESKVVAGTAFGLPVTFKGKDNRSENVISLYQHGGKAYVEAEAISVNIHLISQYKVLIPRSGSGSPTMGKPVLAEPASACTDAFLLIASFDDLNSAQNMLTYLNTGFVRFMLLLSHHRQDTGAKMYKLVPDQAMQTAWSDEKLYARYGLTQAEIDFIASMV